MKENYIYKKLILDENLYSSYMTSRKGIKRSLKELKKIYPDCEVTVTIEVHN